MARAITIATLVTAIASPAHAHLRDGLARNVGRDEAKHVARATHRVWKKRRAHQWQGLISCESRFDKDAVNGQYLGLTQMGSDERAAWNWGRRVVRQLRASHRYWVYARDAWGNGFAPWACDPS